MRSRVVHGAGDPAVIVGVGAAARPSSALCRLLSAIPTGHGLSLIIAQCDPAMDPEQLAAELERGTDFEVVPARDGDLVRTDVVYIAPADRALVVRGHSIQSAPTSGEGADRRIDALFESLALQPDHVAGVLLTGGGDDGVAGMRRLHQAGAPTLVQSPEYCDISDLPQAVLDADAADWVLDVYEIAESLIELGRSRSISARHSLSHTDRPPPSTDLRELRRLGEQRRLALESADMGTWEYDFAEQILRPDDRCRELVGVSERIVAMADFLNLVHPDDRDAFERSLTDPFAVDLEGVYDVEFRVLRHRSTRWIRVVGQMLFEDSEHPRRPSRVVGVLMDTTRRRAVEAALREKKERYRLALESGELGTWTIDLKTNKFLWDARARRIYGLPLDHPLDLQAALSSIHPEDRPITRRDLERTIRDGRRYAQEKRVILPDGSVRWVRSRGMAIRPSPDAAPVRVIGVVQDVTAERRIREDLEQANRRKDDFLAMLSHELRNPLAAIRSAGELLRMSTTDDPVVRRTCRILNRQSAHMAKLLDGLLDVSRITRGLVSIDQRRLDLTKVLRTVLDDRGGDFERTGLDLHVDIDSSPIWVDGDDARLVQIFDNLLSNAIKYSERGGTVSVSAHRRGGAAQVTVRDTGVGFDPELQRRLFEPFQQGPQDLARSRGGLGLGLALAKGLVELHEGSIEAYSAGPGQGSVFTVRLPLSASEQPVEPWYEPPAPNGKLSIMVVEDNEDAGMMLKDLLEGLGHDVTWVDLGDQALSLARDLHPDVMVCDLGLPDMSGYELVERLRSDPEMEGTRYIALSGYGRDEDKARSKQVGFTEHLTKPIRLSALQHLLAPRGHGTPQA